MKTKELIDEARELSQQTEAIPVPPPPPLPKRPSARWARRLVESASKKVIDALNMRVWSELNDELAPGRAQHAKALRDQEILERNDDAEILEEVSPFLESTLERDAHKRVIKSIEDPDHLTMIDYQRLTHRMREQMVGEGYLRSFYAAEANEVAWRKVCNVKPQRHHDPRMVELQRMARALMGES